MRTEQSGGSAPHLQIAYTRDHCALHGALDLEYVAGVFRTWSCTNPLDRIYGFLHVVEWPRSSTFRAASPLRPDYSKSLYELMLDCMDTMIWHGSDMGGGSWTPVSQLMKCLRMDDSDSNISDLLAQRRATGDTVVDFERPTQRESLSFGLFPGGRVQVYGKFAFYPVSRLGKIASNMFTTALAFSTDGSEDGRTRLPLLLPEVKGSLLDVQDGIHGFSAGYISPEAREGDLILQPANIDAQIAGCNPYLVARELPHLGIFEIIGYAAISVNCWMEENVSWLINDHVRHLAVKGSTFEGAFCKEDVVAFYSLWDRNRASSASRSQQVLISEIVGTRFAVRRFSSFIISWNEVGRREQAAAPVQRRASWPGPDFASFEEYDD